MELVEEFIDISIEGCPQTGPHCSIGGCRDVEHALLRMLQKLKFRPVRQL